MVMCNHIEYILKISLKVFPSSFLSVVLELAATASLGKLSKIQIRGSNMDLLNQNV